MKSIEQQLAEEKLKNATQEATIERERRQKAEAQRDKARAQLDSERLRKQNRRLTKQNRDLLERVKKVAHNVVFGEVK